MISSSEQTIITDENIKSLVNTYITNKKALPVALQGKRIGSWDVSRVTNMVELFENYTDFNEPLTGWNVDNVTNMYGMFYGCSNFNKPLFNLNVGNKVTDMGFMFDGCTKFDQNLNNWNVDNVTDMESMFDGCGIQNRNKPRVKPSVMN